MESVDLSDANIAQASIDNNNDKGPISLEQIRIEESEERLGNYSFDDNYELLLYKNCDSASRGWLMTTKMNNGAREKENCLSETCENYHLLLH